MDTNPEGAAPVVVELTPWNGPWPDDDPDANFKADVAAHRHLDPLSTIGNLSRSLDVPVGALVHYVLARWATEGSAGLLEVGPRMVQRLNAVCERAETDGTDAARLAAYHELRQLIAWLHVPLDRPEVYPAQRGIGPDEL